MSRFHLFGTYSRADTFVPRMVSAAVLAPLAVLAAWRGGPVLAGLAAVASVLMGWEWGRLTEGRFGRGAWLVVAVELAGVGLAAFGRLEVGLGILTLGAVARLAWPPGAIGANLWAGAGTLWIGAGCVSLLWLASDPTSGRATVLWLFALVWVTDSAAYLVGRSVGGPRLAPRWSPRKTWSGAVGGIAAAGIVGAISAKTLGIPCFRRYLGSVWGYRSRRNLAISWSPRPSVASAPKIPADSFPATVACSTASTACWRPWWPLRCWP